jgi:alpha-2-macroglobulin-like protein
VTFEDALTLPIRVVAKGFPRQQSNGGSIGSTQFSQENPSQAAFDFSIPATVQNGSSEFSFKLYSSTFQQLNAAIEALINEPSGCFEQTSSSTYPMVMGLQYLKGLPEDQQNDLKIKSMIIDIEAKLKRGYDKLVSFKTKEKGYEWFGESPAHEALSAYGLMQFTEMSQVTSFVDSTMVSDLKDWLVSRKDGSGLFLANERALDTFGRAPDNITAAYIVWTLTEAGETNVKDEIDNLKALADKQIAEGAVDAYFCGLLASSLYNLDRAEEA